MKRFLLICRVLLLACVAFVPASSTASGAQAAAPPNWRGSGVGTTAPDPVIPGVDRDIFAAQSSHLGKVVGAGFHRITGPIFRGADLVGFTFAGGASWQAANGDVLNVSYAGVISFTGDPVYPFGFVADLAASGGTGRFAAAKGVGKMAGAFTGVPGEFYFSFAGTLNVTGK